MRTPVILASLSAATLVLAGCAPTSAADDGVLRVVASTSVYGDVAATVAGDLAEVSSIVSSTSQDPHSYEVTARDRLTLESADLVVFNGGGYDPFVDTVLEAMTADPETVEAVEVAGLDEGDAHDDDAHDDDHGGHQHLEGANEHVWYDVHVMHDVALAIARELGDLDPDNAATYLENADAFAADIHALEVELAAVAERADGAGVVITEPVPGYLLAEAGFTDVTPEGFSAAIEEGSDVSPALLQATLAAVADAAIVSNNPQTAGPETAEVLAAADAAGVPVVDFLELLPEGSDYVSWMRDNIAALAAALP